jgi:DNA invertase Pin-like site-specific DNA recombinase
MTMIGYARVSSQGQDLAIQEDALKAAGCTIIRSEKATGTKLAGRDELATILEFIGRGDTLTVTKLDRLGRSLADLSRIVERLNEKGASLKVLNANIDTGTPTGRAFLGMLGVFAEFETSIRRERQLEGIAKAKAEGVYKGRPATIDAAAVAALKAEGMGATAIVSSWVSVGQVSTDSSASAAQNALEGLQT